MNRENETKIWKKRISDFEASDMTIVDFSRTHGFSLQQYYYRKNKIIKSQSKPVWVPTPQAPQSLLIKVIPQPPTADLKFASFSLARQFYQGPS